MAQVILLHDCSGIASFLERRVFMSSRVAGRSLCCASGSGVRKLISYSYNEVRGYEADAKRDADAAAQGE